MRRFLRFNVFVDACNGCRGSSRKWWFHYCKNYTWNIVVLYLNYFSFTLLSKFYLKEQSKTSKPPLIFLHVLSIFSIFQCIFFWLQTFWVGFQNIWTQKVPKRYFPKNNPRKRLGKKYYFQLEVCNLSMFAHANKDIVVSGSFFFFIQLRRLTENFI